MSANDRMNFSAEGAVVLTPDDDVLFPATRGLYVGTGGDVAVTMKNGKDVVFPDVPDGAILPICIVKLLATGTGASGFVGLT